MIGHLASCLMVVGCFSEPGDKPACQPPRKLTAMDTTREYSAWMSEDRLELLYASDDGGTTPTGIFRSTRSALTDDFSPGIRISAPALYAFDPFVVGNTVYFNEDNGELGSPIYAGTLDASEITDIRIVFPELGTNILHPSFTGDGLTIVYAHSEPAPLVVRDSFDLYMATRPSVDAAFQAPHVLANVSTPARDAGPAIAADGQTLLFDTELGHTGYSHLARARRQGDDFVDPTPLDLGATGNAQDFNPFLHPDGQTIVFATDRASALNPDLWIDCE